MTTPTRAVREIALEQQTSTRELEQWKNDHTDVGAFKHLAKTRCTTNLEVDELIAVLEAEPNLSDWELQSWTGESLARLSSHIVTNHHAHVKRALPRLTLLAREVVDLCGSTETKLPVIALTLERLDEDLNKHLAKDEIVLFPYITDLEQRLSIGIRPPHVCFEIIANPIVKTMQEHDAVGNLIAEIRQLSDDFTAPEDACPAFHALYDELKEFERDLHRSIQLENNILFPRALGLEESAS
jgi:regulator of cell morphogenesis and NO signaling